MLIPFGLFQGAKVVTLQILDDLNLQHLVVSEVTDQRGDGGDTSQFAGTVAALTGDQLVRGTRDAPAAILKRFLQPATGQRTHQHRLMHAAGFDAVSQLGQLDRIKGLAWVGQAADDRFNAQVVELVGLQLAANWAGIVSNSFAGFGRKFNHGRLL